MKQYNFSDELQQVIQKAETDALNKGHQIIVPLHLMTALLELGDQKVEYWLKIHNIDPGKLLKTLQEALEEKGNQEPDEDMAISPQTREALRMSGIIALESQESEVKPLHLLLALLYEADQELSGLFSRLGVSLSSLDDLIYIGELKRSFNEDKSLLAQFSVDLSELVHRRSRKPLAAEWSITATLLEVISRIYRNVPLLVGGPGIEKSLLAEGLAYRLSQGEGRLEEPRVLHVLTDAMMSQAKDPNEFVELFRQFLNEASEHSETILYFDEIYPDFTGSGPLDLPMLLKSVLRQGILRIIASSKRENISLILDQDPFLKEKVHMIKMKHLSPDKVLTIINESKKEIETFHNISISSPLALQAFYLAEQFFNTGEIDGTLQLMDMAATQIRLKARTKSTRRMRSEDLYQAVSETLGVPAWRISGDRRYYDSISEKLKKVIVGQEEAIESVAEIVTTRETPFNLSPQMPNGIMLFVGPRGVGKKELIRSLADVLFEDSERISVFDMSRFEEPESLWELTGYADKSKGEMYPSTLTRVLQKYPLSILFLEEIDKACPDVQRFFAEIFRSGSFTDNLGQISSLSGVTVIMTVKAYEEKKKQLGFTPDSEVDYDVDAVHSGLAALLDTEIMEIIDKVVIFKELRDKELKKIVQRSLLHHLKERWDIQWVPEDKLLQFLVEQVKAKKDKLRSMERLFQIHIFAPLALALGRMDLTEREKIVLGHDGKDLTIQ
ncbi:MAG TPA: hypothetical protein ENN72_07945 [Firmicutes bacterium]|nr:hypothetical protein [Bacillota bacterium]